MSIPQQPKGLLLGRKCQVWLCTDIGKRRRSGNVPPCSRVVGLGRFGLAAPDWSSFQRKRK
jgi:hypothetical protein